MTARNDPGFDRLEDLVLAVHAVTPHRSLDTMLRRIAKLTEEVGETSEAFLGCTSPYNFKGMSWNDFHEELVDCLIVAIDLALTPMPGTEPGDRLDHVLVYIEHLRTGHYSDASTYPTEDDFLTRFLLHGPKAISKLTGELVICLADPSSAGVHLAGEQRHIFFWFYQFAMTQTPGRRDTSFAGLAEMAGKKVAKWVNAKKGEDA